MKLFCVNLRDSGTESVSLAAAEPPPEILLFRPVFGVVNVGGAVGVACVDVVSWLSLPPLLAAVTATTMFSGSESILTFGRSVVVELGTVVAVSDVVVAVIRESVRVVVVVVVEEIFVFRGTSVSSAEGDSAAIAVVVVVVILVVEDFVVVVAAEAVAAAIIAADDATQEVVDELCLFCCCWSDCWCWRWRIWDKLFSGLSPVLNTVGKLVDVADASCSQGIAALLGDTHRI